MYNVFFCRLVRPLVSLTNSQIQRKPMKQMPEKIQKVPWGPSGPNIMYSNVPDRRTAQKNIRAILRALAESTVISLA